MFALRVDDAYRRLLIELARKAQALPGAPLMTGSTVSVRMPRADVYEDVWCLRNPSGLLWFSDPDQPGSTTLANEKFLLDLTDYGTGGVLFAVLTAYTKNIVAHVSPDSAILYDTPDGYLIGAGKTLAEACCDAAVRRGTWLTPL